jgi:hypothetical protein
MITSNGLKHLGFRPEVDYVLQNDGNGTYIRDWLSSSPRPTTADIEAAHNQWDIHRASEIVAKKDRLDSVKAKLKALGLNDAEVASITGG